MNTECLYGVSGSGQGFPRMHVQGVHLCEVAQPRWNFTFELVIVKTPDKVRDIECTTMAITTTRHHIKRTIV